MLTGSWPSPAGGEEFALTFDQQLNVRLLVIPALFDESNKLRHFTVEVMRRLDASGVDCMLPDLPGTNESLAGLADQTLASWRDAMTAAAAHFSATHVLTIRAGAALAPAGLSSLHYAPQAPKSQLRAMLRAEVLTAREAGTTVTRDELAERGRREGITLAGYHLSAAMFADLLDGEPSNASALEITQADLGGPGLWLRAEPAHNAAQGEALAALVLEHLR